MQPNMPQADVNHQINQPHTVSSHSGDNALFASRPVQGSLAQKDVEHIQPTTEHQNGPARIHPTYAGPDAAADTPGIRDPEKDIPDLENEYASTTKPPTTALGRYRARLVTIVESTPFTAFILLCIATNAVLLLVDSPGVSPQVRNILDLAELIFLSIFTAEAALKLIAYGPIDYFASFWNVLDFGVVLIGWIAEASTASANLSGLRLVRVIRPLRTIGRVESMRVLVETIIKSVPGLGNVALMLLLLLYIFAIFALQLWKGVLNRRCYSLDSASGLYTLIQSEADTPCSHYSLGRQCSQGTFCMEPSTLPASLCAPGQEVCPYRELNMNFDNIGTATLLLFKLFTTDDWPNDLAPLQQAYAQPVWPYFVVVILMGAFFAVNLLIAILNSNFMAEWEEYQKRDKVCRLSMQKDENPKMYQLFPPDSLVARIFTHWMTQLFFTLSTITNITLLCLVHYNMNPTLFDVVHYTNIVCTSIFLVEVPLRIATQGRAYFDDFFQILDIVLGIGSILEFALADSASMSGFRALRLLRVMTRWHGLRRTLSAIILSLKSVGALLLLLFLLMFVYTVLGFQLFYGVSADGPRFSYSTWWESALTVFIVVTGESWATIMSITMTETNPAAFIFYVSLFSLGNWVLLNLLISIFMHSFNTLDMEEEAEDPKPVIVQDTDNSLSAYSFSFVVRNQMGKTGGNKSEEKQDLRDKLQALLAKPLTQRVIIGLILLNCLVLLLTTYDTEENCLSKPCSAWEWFVWSSNIFFAAAFTIELVISLIAYGPRAFFRSIMYWIDTLVVVFAWLSIFYPYFAGIRSLRVIRIAFRISSLRMVIIGLCRAIPPVFSCLVILTCTFTMFGMVGIQLFAGRIHYCMDAEEEMITANAIDCASKGGEWKAPWFNFDNIMNSFLSLFVVSLGEGWADVMWSGIDATPVGLMPEHNYNPAVSLFFVVFMVLCGVIIMQLFIGILIDTYSNSRQQYLLHTNEQREWITSVKLSLSMPLRKHLNKPSNCLSTSLAKIVCTTLFDYVITGCIVVNIIFMGTEFYMQPDWWKTTLDIVNIVFVSIFLLETIAKLIALGPRLYFQDRWNCFDCLISILSVVAVVVTAPGASAIRLFRIGRICRIIKKAKQLHHLFYTLIFSLPSLGNISFLLVLIYFIFTVIGISLFGDIPFEQIDTIPGLTKEGNFQNSYLALPLLFIVSTTEGWTDVMIGCFRQCIPKEELPSSGIHPALWEGQDEYCFGSYLSVPYYIFFLILTTFIMLNALVTIVVESFEGNAVDWDNIAVLKYFQERWVLFDPDINKAISPEECFTILCYLPTPVGLGLHVRHMTKSGPVSEDPLPPIIRAAMSARNLRKEIYEKERHQRRLLGSAGKAPSLGVPSDEITTNLSTLVSSHFLELLDLTRHLNIPISKDGVIWYDSAIACITRYLLRLDSEELKIFKSEQALPPVGQDDTLGLHHWLAVKRIQFFIKQKMTRPGHGRVNQVNMLEAVSVPAESTGTNGTGMLNMDGTDVRQRVPSVELGKNEVDIINRPPSQLL